MSRPIELRYWPIISDQRQIAYGVMRYTNETHRLYGVLEKQLAGGISSAANCPSPTSRPGPGLCSGKTRALFWTSFRT